MRPNVLYLSVSIGLCLAAGSAFSAPAVTDSTQPASSSPAGAVSCLVSPARVSDESIVAFLAAPEDIYRDVAGDRDVNALVLSSRIRSLAASSSDTLIPLLELAKTATPSQQAAIGAGLARAATSCVSANAEYASKIQVAVAELNSPVLAEAFAGGLDDVQTSALAGASGAGPSASSIGGGGDAGGGTRGIVPDDVYTNGDDPLSFTSRKYSGSVVSTSSVSPSDVTP